MKYGFLNTQLLNMAEQMNKEAFVDPAMMQGGGMPPGGDPAAMGGDPAAMGGMPPGGDPAAMGGAPPPAGGDPMALLPLITQAVQQGVAGAGGGGGAGAGAAGAGGLKPKIDVNVTMLQILKILARIADALSIQIPASEMVATSGDLNQFANQQQAGAQGQPQQSAISPISPIQGASPAMAQGGGGGEKQGYAFDPADHFDETAERASAIMHILAKRKVG